VKPLRYNALGGGALDHPTFDLPVGLLHLEVDPGVGIDLAVSLYIPDANVRPSQHGAAYVTSYLTANGAGDVASDEMAQPFSGTITSMPWRKAIDVFPSSSTGSIVAFGDSITDGTCSTVDAHDRWEDVLAVRLALAAAGQGDQAKSADPRRACAAAHTRVPRQTAADDGQPARCSRQWGKSG